jgi:hypothetical protein
VSVAPLVQAHMPSTLSAAAAAVVALLFWTVLGLSISRRILPHALALPLAPSLGWAVHSAAGLVLFLLFGFSAVAVAVFATVAAITSIASLFQKIDGPAPEGTVPPWAYVAAAVLALAPAAAVVPEHLGDSVVVASPIYDHAKVAIIDAITRLGLPPANPFFGELGEPDRLAYYYLWYSSGAQLAALLGLTGWEADIALTWFSAFSSLSLMMGLALWFGRRSAPVWALLFAATGSLRFFIWLVLGAQWLDGLLAHPAGFAGWLFQSAWVPQHLMSASCVVLAVLLMSRLAEQRSWFVFITLVLVVVAGFESSTWIGGITFVFAAVVGAVVLFVHIAPSDRWRLALRLAGASALSVVLAAPFVLDQIADVEARSGGAPIVIGHLPVLGDWFADPVRSLLDYPAYWLVLLPVEMPATYVAGVVALGTFLASRKLDRQRQRDAALLAVLTVAGLVVSWLLVSTIGDNNDLALRAVLPAAVILIIFSAAGLSVWMATGARIAAGATLCGLLLGFPDAAQMIYGNVIDRRPQPGREFAQTPAMWEAVRRHSRPGERVGNNPLFLEDMTPWPVNLSWALLSNRSSCFAGRELTLAYAPLSPRQREEINALFIRVFAGNGSGTDVRDLALRFGCRAIVLTSEDGAWQRDPFAASGLYQLVESSPERWRIYRSISAADAP